MSTSIDYVNNSRIPWGAFTRLVIIQAQNAFNEKGAQFVLIPLGVWLAANCGYQGDLEYPLGAIIVLPFVLFSPIVGWISDHFAKARVIQYMALTQVIVLLGMFVSLYVHHLNMAIFWFTLFAIQATVFSPAKKGIVKDLVGEKNMGFASGILEMASILSILGGQIGAFFWFPYLLDAGSDSIWHEWLPQEFFAWFDAWVKPSGVNDGWYAASFPCLVFLLAAIPVAISSLFLPKFEPQNKSPFRWSLFYEHFTQLAKLWRHPVLRTCEVGIGYFWFFGGTIMLMTIQMAKELSGGANDFGTIGAMLMVWMSGGTVLGGVLASLLCSKGVKLKVSVMGGILMTLSCVLLSFVPMSSSGFYACLMLAGVSAAFFLVPINAYFQNSADNAERGDMIAAGNLVDCVLGLLAVGFQYLMMLCIPSNLQFIVMASLSLAVTSVFVKFAKSRG